MKFFSRVEKIPLNYLSKTWIINFLVYFLLVKIFTNTFDEIGRMLFTLKNKMHIVENFD